MANQIKLQDLTPEVYYKKSRDFQFIGRLFDVVLNNVKLNSDLIYNCPISDNSDEKLLDLMALTLGFKSKHNYNIDQLKALCSAFVEVIRYKGTKYAIKTACNALLHAEGIDEEVEVTFDETNYLVTIYLPATLNDINLLRDLLDYVLPAGISSRIIRENNIKTTASITMGLTTTVTKIWYPENATVDDYRDYTMSIIPQPDKLDADKLKTGIDNGLVNSIDVVRPDKN